MPETKSLLIDCRVGDVVQIEVPVRASADSPPHSEIVSIRIEEKTGRQARMRVEASPSIRIAKAKRQQPG